MWKKILICCVLIVFGISENTNALNLGSTDYYSWTTSGSRVYTNSDYWALSYAQNGGIYREVNFTNGDEYITYFHLCLAGTIPAYNLITFSINIKTASGYLPVNLYTRDTSLSLLNYSSGDYGRSTYTFYNNSALSGCYDFYVPDRRTFTVGDSTISISGINTIRITDSGGDSGGDYNTQLNQIRYLQQDQYNRLVDILSNLSTIKNGQITESEMTEAIEQAKESEKEEIQDASDEGETAANEAGEKAEKDTATITEQMGNIFEAFNTEATDCVIPLNLGHGVNAGNLNLCSEVPQTVRNLVGYVSMAIVALVVIRLLNTIINTYLEYIESFQR